MPKAPDTLLGRIVTLSTHNQNAWTKWQVVMVDMSTDRIWFRSLQSRERLREPSKLSWFWKRVGDGSLILE